jgi:hypothetical protein
MGALTDEGVDDTLFDPKVAWLVKADVEAWDNS